MRSSWTVVLATLALASLACPAMAQNFGRNKVQHERFDFKVLATDHFDIYYYPEEDAAVRLAARMAERWYARLSQLLEHQLRGRQPLILYAAHPHFQQTNVLSGEIGEGTGGVTESLKRRVILPFAGGLAETDHVLGHELVHAFQYDMAERTDMQGNPIGPALRALPLWFIEGMAEYLSLGPVDANTSMWVREASARNGMPTIDRLDDPDFFPYRYGHALWAYVAGRWGDRAVGEMFRATGPEGDIEHAIRAVLGTDADTLSQQWHDDTKRAFAAVYRNNEAGQHIWAHVGHPGDWRRRAESVAIDQPGWEACGISVGALAVFDRYVHRRCGDGQDWPSTRRNDERPPFRQPAVPELGRRLGVRQPPICLRGLERRSARAGDHRRRQRPARSRARVHRTW